MAFNPNAVSSDGNTESTSQIKTPLTAAQHELAHLIGRFLAIEWSASVAVNRDAGPNRDTLPVDAARPHRSRRT